MGRAVGRTCWTREAEARIARETRLHHGGGESPADEFFVLAAHRNTQEALRLPEGRGVGDRSAVQFDQDLVEGLYTSRNTTT
jgi:hypothetical protein